MLRMVIALIAGFAIMTFIVLLATITEAVATGGVTMNPTGAHLAVNLGYTVVAAAVGGYATASLAPARPDAHAAVLAAMTLVVRASEWLFPQPGQARLYLVLLMLLAPLGVLAGGWLRGAQVRHRRPAA